MTLSTHCEVREDETRWQPSFNCVLATPGQDLTSAAAFSGHVAAEVVDVRLLAMDDHHKSIAAVIGRESKGGAIGRESTGQLPLTSGSGVTLSLV